MNVKLIFGYFFLSVDVIIGLAIVIIVLLHGGKIRGIGTAITGTSDSDLFEEEKQNITERFSSGLLWLLGFLFMTWTLITIILFKYSVLTLS